MKAGISVVVLESGPPGMELLPSGLLTWAVPKEFPDAKADIILSVSGATRQEEFQTFTIDIVTRKP